MVILSAGLVIFFGAHLYSAFRSRVTGSDIKKRLGVSIYMGTYSLVSGVGLGLIIWGYSISDPGSYLYTGFIGNRQLTALLMGVAVVLIVSAYLPTGFVKHTVRHPMLIAVGLWSLAHLLDGADWRQLALFGSFLAYSVIDLVAVSLRDKPVKNSESIEPRALNDLMVFVTAALVFSFFIFWGHQWLFGVAPLNMPLA